MLLITKVTVEYTECESRSDQGIWLVRLDEPPYRKPDGTCRKTVKLCYEP